jgi:hypothetical protein
MCGLSERKVAAKQAVSAIGTTDIQPYLEAQMRRRAAVDQSINKPTVFDVMGRVASRTTLSRSFDCSELKSCNKSPLGISRLKTLNDRYIS